MYESLEVGTPEINIFFAGIKLKLIDQAYELIKSTSLTTYEEFKNLLIKTYLPKISINELKQLFYNCAQGFDEPTSEYLMRLRDHLYEIIETHAEKFGRNEAIIDVFQLEAVDIFKRGSNNTGLKSHLILDESRSLTELEITINKYENAEKEISNGFSFGMRNESIRVINFGQDSQEYVYNQQMQFQQIHGISPCEVCGAADHGHFECPVFGMMGDQAKRFTCEMIAEEQQYMQKQEVDDNYPQYWHKQKN